MIKIYHVPLTRSLRPIWLCEELGLNYEIIPVDFSPEYRASEEWRKINPVGKVPAMSDGELTMMESGAMLQYLLDRYAPGRLQPDRGTAEHAIYLQWGWFAESTFARPLGEIVNHSRKFPGPNSIQAVLDEMADRAILCMQAVAAETQNKDYICGSEFNAADIMMGYSISVAEHLIADQIPAELLPYWNRLKERPAYQRTIAV
jgi:glutathione S-transferase